MHQTQNGQSEVAHVKKKDRLFLIIFLLAVGQLVYDLTSPLGICDTVWYFIPLYLSIYVGGRYFSYLLAGIFSLLILVGFHLSPAGIDPSLALIGRLANISALWIMSLLISHHKEAMILILRARQQNEHAESALSASESRLQFLLTATSAITYSLRVTGDFAATFVSRNVQTVLGHQPEDFIATPGFWQANLHPDDAIVAVTAANFFSDATASVLTREYRFRHRNSTYRWIHDEMCVARDSQGQPKEFAGYWIDITRRKLAEQTLKQSEERYRLLFELESDGVVLFDVETHRVVDVNLSAQKLYGYSREEFLQLKVEDGSAEPEKTRAMVGRAPYTVQRRWHRKKNGEQFIVEATVAPIHHQGRRMELATVRDITANEQAKDALQRAANASELLRQCMVTINASHNFDSALACLMQKAMDSGGMDCAAIYLIEGQDAVMRQQVCLDPAFAEQVASRPLSTDCVNAALENPQEIVNIGNQFPEQHQLCEAYGLRHVYCIALMAGEQPFGFLNVASRRVEPPSGADIEFIHILALEAGSLFLRFKVQDRLRLVSAEQRIILDSTPGAVCYLKNRKIQWANPAFSRILGYTEEESVGLESSMFYVSREDYERVGRAGYEQLSKGEIYSAELQIKRKDGSLLWANIAGRFVDQQNPAEGSIWIVFDLTERKQAEEERKNFDAQNRQLQKSESLSRMAGAIAHHFNNQLQAVMMSLEMAMQNQSPNAAPVENLSEAMHSARKAAEVSSLMLTYLGKTAAKRQPLDLCEACRRQLPMLHASMPQSVALETDFLISGLAIHANESQVQQVLTNLVTNAWEASGEGQGTIRLTVKKVSATVIPVTHRFPIDGKLQAADYACLEVADTGCGIAPADMDKLFDPFFSNKFTGRGLGLAVVLGIVRAHGGAITVESQPDRGSIFRVFFPLTAEAVALKPVQAARPLQTAESVTVLVVEDEPSVRKMVALALKRSGFTVFTAEDGVQAVEMFQQHRDEIDCVLCDLTMPRMNGWETLAALRKLSPGIPVILASGYSKDQVMANDQPEQPQEFLGKPYELKTLNDAIARVMMNKRESHS